MIHDSFFVLFIWGRRPKQKYVEFVFCTSNGGKNMEVQVLGPKVPSFVEHFWMLDQGEEEEGAPPCTVARLKSYMYSLIWCIRETGYPCSDCKARLQELREPVITSYFYHQRHLNGGPIGTPYCSLAPPPLSHVKSRVAVSTAFASARPTTVLLSSCYLNFYFGYTRKCLR